MRKCAPYTGSPFQAELMLLGYYLSHYIMVYLLVVYYYYYYYYYRKKRFRWRNVKRLQGQLTNAKDSDKTRVRRKVRTEYLTDEIVGRAVEVRKTSSEQFRLQLTFAYDVCVW